MNRKNILKALCVILFLFIVAQLNNGELIFLSVPFVFAHCDTMDGPVIKDAQKALETKNADIVLKWVQKKDEKEIKDLFVKTLDVRKINQQSKELADMYFFENLVRIHRAGEGASYDGIKPSGSEIEPGVEAADKAVETGSADHIAKEISENIEKSIKDRFTELQGKKKHAEDSVEAGREYVESYVSFIHYIEKLHQIIFQKLSHSDESEAVVEHGH